LFVVCVTAFTFPDQTNEESTITEGISNPLAQGSHDRNEQQFGQQDSEGNKFNLQHKFTLYSQNDKR
jgi:hypothetical protein